MMSALWMLSAVVMALLSIRQSRRYVRQQKERDARIVRDLLRPGAAYLVGPQFEPRENNLIRLVDAWWQARIAMAADLIEGGAR